MATIGLLSLHLQSSHCNSVLHHGIGFPSYLGHVTGQDVLESSRPPQWVMTVEADARQICIHQTPHVSQKEQHWFRCAGPMSCARQDAWWIAAVVINYNSGSPIGTARCWRHQTQRHFQVCWLDWWCQKSRSINWQRLIISLSAAVSACLSACATIFSFPSLSFSRPPSLPHSTIATSPSTNSASSLAFFLFPATLFITNQQKHKVIYRAYII